MNLYVTFTDKRKPVGYFRLTKERFDAKIAELEKEFLLLPDGVRSGIYYLKAQPRKPNND